MNKSLKNLLLFLFFFTVTSILYISTIHSKFVFDFIDLVFDFQKRGWGDLGSLISGLSPYLVSKGVIFIALKIWGFNAYAWYVFSCLLHALNALLLFLFIERIFIHFDYQQPTIAAGLAAALFLVSPFHTEAVVWGGALNYLIVSVFVLLHFHVVFEFIKSGSKLHLAIAGLTLFAAMFSHEWGLFLLPADFLLLFFLVDDFKKMLSSKYLLLVILLLTGIAYYFFNQWLRGSLVGHYGAETHLNFKLQEIIPAFCKYLLKILLLFTLFPVRIQDKVYAIIQQVSVIHSLSLVFLLIAIACLVLIWKNKKKFGAMVFFFALFCVFVMPVLNLYFPYWINIHADRYCYLPSAFIYASCVAILFRSNSFLKFVLPSVGFVLSVWFLYSVNSSWSEAEKLTRQLERNFKWWDAKRVYILNLPDNFRGAYMYRNLRPSAFEGNFIKYNYLIPKTEIIEVLNYNLGECSDSVVVEKTNDAQLKVTLSKPGIWWWYKTLGAIDYETDKVKVDVDDSGHFYVVDFKQMQAGDVFLYQANGEWREVLNF